MLASRVDRMAPPGWVRTDAHPTSFIMIIMGGNARSRANTAPQTANARAKSKTQRQTSSRRVGGKKSQAGRAIHRARMLDG